MNKKTFCSIIEQLKMASEKSYAVHKLGIDLLGFEETYENVITALLKDKFNEEQMGWIDWYLWERESLAKPGTYNKAYKKVGRKKIEICHNVDSLFELVHDAGHPKKIMPDQV